ncbi:unnamed protein product [Protopolystoma xenopodis]|uniref:Uncharacterized protein n=1 Tax=Protopolystoma xenopodis TaxID=117903 RepID=A0A3S5B0H5_9PLAT|nr:unnamed protein product [Protopolystoma xenopodis]
MRSGASLAEPNDFFFLHFLLGDTCTVISQKEDVECHRLNHGQLIIFRFPEASTSDRYRLYARPIGVTGHGNAAAEGAKESDLILIAEEETQMGLEYIIPSRNADTFFALSAI